MRNGRFRIGRFIAAAAWLAMAALLVAYALREIGLADQARRSTEIVPPGYLDRIVASYTGPAELASIVAVISVILAAAETLWPRRSIFGISLSVGLFGFMYGSWLALTDPEWRIEAVAFTLLAATITIVGLVGWRSTEAPWVDQQRPWHMPPPTHQN